MAGPRDGRHPGLDAEAALAEIEKLQTDRAYRDATGLYAIEGVRNFVSAVDGGMEIAAIVVSDKLLKVPIARKMARASRRAGVPSVAVTPEQFRRIAPSRRASGIAAIVRQHWSELRRASPGVGLCWVALETVRSPGNLGSLIRTSEAVGGAGFILLGKAVDPFDPVVVRATMGALFGQVFVRTDLSELGHWLDRHDCRVVGASPDGPRQFHHLTYPERTVLMLGEERRGLTEQQRAICHQLVQIPMTGPTDSLNLGVAGSLLLYEVFRSRTGRGNDR
jgi:TrmH family RNA methyltransferase